MLAYVRKYREAILLALAIFVIQACLASVLSRFVENDALRRDSLATQQMLQSVYDDGLPQGAHSPLYAQGIETFGKRVTALPGMVRANIYSADRFIRFSSDWHLMGIKFADNEELESAFAGQVVTGLDNTDSNVKAEHLALGGLSDAGSPLIEAYIPLRNSAGKIETVVEYYKKPNDREVSTAAVTKLIWLSCAAAAAAILAFSLVVIAGARRS